MHKKFVFLSDFSAEEIPYGGAEINDRELVNLLKERGHEISELRTRNFTLRSLKDTAGSCFIISNFALLRPEVISAFNKEKYVIYEHDHKYLASRNPALYQDYKVPPEHIINKEFYKNAVATFCQTAFHAKILKSNLALDNIVSLGGNLWSLEILEKIRELSKKNKSKVAAIMDSSTPHKNTLEAKELCAARNIEYKLIPKMKYLDFLEELSNCLAFVFVPKTPETCSRVLVEAKMLDLSVVTNSKSGAVHEEWFSLKGSELVDRMLQKREEIVSIVEQAFDNSKAIFYPELEKKDS